MTETEAHGFMTVWDKNGALNSPVLNRPLEGRYDWTDGAPGQQT
jgi:hypothetical protein